MAQLHTSVYIKALGQGLVLLNQLLRRQQKYVMCSKYLSSSLHQPKNFSSEKFELQNAIASCAKESTIKISENDDTTDNSDRRPNNTIVTKVNTINDKVVNSSTHSFKKLSLFRRSTLFTSYKSKKHKNKNKVYTVYRTLLQLEMTDKNLTMKVKELEDMFEEKADICNTMKQHMQMLKVIRRSLDKLSKNLNEIINYVYFYFGDIVQCLMNGETLDNTHSALNHNISIQYQDISDLKFKIKHLETSLELMHERRKKESSGSISLDDVVSNVLFKYCHNSFEIFDEKIVSEPNDNLNENTYEWTWHGELEDTDDDDDEAEVNFIPETETKIKQNLTEEEKLVEETKELLKFMKDSSIPADNKFYTLTLTTIDGTIEAEKKLIDTMYKNQIKPDIAFCHTLFRRRLKRKHSLRLKTALLFLKKHDVKPSQETFVILAATCISVKSIDVFLSTVQEYGFKPTSEMFSELLKLSSSTFNSHLKTVILNHMMQYNVQPDFTFLNTLEDQIDSQVMRLLEMKKQNDKKTIAEEVQFRKFLQIYEEFMNDYLY